MLPPNQIQLPLFFRAPWVPNGPQPMCQGIKTQTSLFSIFLSSRNSFRPPWIVYSDLEFLLGPVGLLHLDALWKAL